MPDLPDDAYNRRLADRQVCICVRTSEVCMCVQGELLQMNSRHFRVRGYNMFLFQGLANDSKVALQKNTRNTWRQLLHPPTVLSSLSSTSIMVSPFHPSLPSSSVLPELSHGPSQFIPPQFPRAVRLPGVQLCWISSTSRLNLQKKKKRC